MISLLLSLTLVFVAAVLSLLFSSLTYALRSFSRGRLSDQLTRMNMSQWLDSTVKHSGDFLFVTAFCRMFTNLFVFIGVMHVLHETRLGEWSRYGIALSFTAAITLFCSVTIPHAIADHAGEMLIAVSVRFLHALRITLLPLTRIMHVVDRFIQRLAGVQESKPGALNLQIEHDILSVVEEGQRDGIVDTVERALLQSVIQFRITSVREAMTGRGDIVGLPATAKLPEVKLLLEESGHSRIPVYDGTLDKIVGILYARDLLRYLGQQAGQFEIRSAMRPAFYVPETKPLRDLLQDFRAQKVHLAIALDEYGGTSGLVTIEDVLEQIVGEISDEHEGLEPAMFKRLDEQTAEVDARMMIAQLNRLLSLGLPEDAGYETLGGFVSTTYGRIPPTGTNFESNGARFLVIDAEPQRVNRVRIELMSQPATA